MRQKAAEALGKIGGKQAIEALINGLNDQNQYHFVLLSAAQGVENIRDEFAIPKLLKVLEEHKDFPARQSAAEALGNIRSERAIDGLIKTLKDDDINVCKSAAEALGKIGSSTSLFPLWKLCLKGRWSLYYTIAAIQKHCNFYNYEIWQDAIQYEKLKIQIAKINENNHRKKQMTEQTKYDSKFIIHGNPTIVEGNMEVKGDNVGTKNIYNYFGADEALLQQITDLQQFIAALETHHPNLQTEAEANQIVRSELSQVQTQNPDLWQKLRHQMELLKRQLLNPERHLQAAKATVVEVTKAAWEKSLILKAVITYLDKLSESPEHGA